MKSEALRYSRVDSLELTTAKTNEWAKLELERLSNRKFWGKVTFTFENGVIQIAEKYEKMKP